MLIDSATVGLLLRLKRDKTDAQKIAFIGSSPVLTEKTIIDRMIDKIVYLMSHG